MLRTLLNSESLRATVALGAGGVAFTLGNLILARALPSAEYGLLSLVIGMLSVASLTAPLGFDLVVARRGWRLGSQLRRAVLATSVVIAIATAVVGAGLYGLRAPLASALAVGTAAAGVVQAGVAHFQGQRRFGVAAWLLQISNVALVPIALLVLLFGPPTASFAAMLFAATALIGAVATWSVISRERDGRGPPPIAALWREALSLVTITTASAVFMQLERLVLAPAIGVHGLALFGVVAALAGSPFRMIQAAVLFTLIPGMRAAPTTRERRRLLGRELIIVTGILACGSMLIWLLAPAVAHWFLAGRYDLSDSLMAAALLSGLLKVLSAFATSVAVALGDERDLRLISVTAWVSIGIAVVAAFAAASWGLAGVLYGISIGWLARILPAAWIAAPHLLQTRGDLAHPVG